MGRWEQHETQFCTEGGVFISHMHSQDDYSVVAAHNSDCDAYESRIADLEAERDELQRRLDAVVVSEPETDITKAVHGRLYLVMFLHLFGDIPEALHFRRDADGEWFWSKYPPNEGGPLYGSSNAVAWFAEIRAVAIAEGRDNG